MGVQKTSRNAYDEVKPSLGERQAMVLGVLTRHANMTNTEIARELNVPINTITPRTHELRALGKVIEDCKRMCSVTGRTVIAWKLRPEGPAKLF